MCSVFWHRFLVPYKCNVCQNLVRGGVITICGHLFCWTCLWPRLSGKATPQCPHCRHCLILHEDIVPFHGEGPNADSNDSLFLAQPGSVPRPTGMYLSDPFPDWFRINDPIDTRPGRLARHEVTWGLDLFTVLSRLSAQHPWVGHQLRFLRCFQLVYAILLCLLWCLVSPT
ncbi:uncharacterized protein LOC108150188 [Drosophila elegans]|uniref:uncharacterized protein LOC108150188 n=1 Tax=Drosophila elegans TaxID=30023 RepID=UPI0007E8B3C9|nr:uncharacterized protein LOC108150188 [Drosophila elegans]XP_017133692.1 uncharacterized protein LOC108150188 [Drosophila elegans]